MVTSNLPVYLTDDSIFTYWRFKSVGKLKLNQILNSKYFFIKLQGPC
jgi:hypothetical protein